MAGCKNSVIPSDGSVTEIENKTFSGCIGLKNVTIPDGVTDIGIWTFQGCSDLTSIVIPNSVTIIGADVFKGCNELKIYCRADKKPKFWDENWNRVKDGLFGKAKVVWGYKGK